MKDNYGYWKSDLVSYHECPHCDGTGFQKELKMRWYSFFPKGVLTNRICGLCKGDRKIEWRIVERYMKQSSMATSYGIFDFKYKDYI